MESAKHCCEEIKIDLDPTEKRKKKEQRKYQLNAIQIPRLRLLGFSGICFFVLIHNVFISKSISWLLFSSFTAILIGYALLSWLILYFLFDRLKSINLGLIFLTVDIFIFILAIYFTGGDKSWLFFLLMFRVADQANTNFKKTVIFSHISVFSYLLLLLYLCVIEHRPIVLPIEAAKILFIYLGNFYISLTAKTSEKLRNRTSASIRMARKEIIRRKHIQKALGQSEARYRQLVNHAPAGIYEIDTQNGKITSVNNVMCQYTGYTREEFLKLDPFDILTDDSKRLFMERHSKSFDDKDVPEIVEYKVRGKDGHEFWVMLNSKVFYEGDKPISVTVVAHDITARKKAEIKLKKSEAKFRDIIENMEEGYIENDLAGNITYINKSACKHMGHSMEEIIGMNAKEFIPAETFKIIFSRYNKVFQTGKPEWIESYENIRKDGSPLLIESSIGLLRDDSGKPIGFRSITRDVTERMRIAQEKKELEERLSRSEKMESLGILAGGVAHDLNNVLSGIVSYPDLLLMDIPQDSSIREPILTIKESGKKAATIVQDLLTLARRGVTTTEILDLNEIVSDYMKSPENDKILSYHPKIQIETNLSAELSNLRGSSVHIKKTIMNLVSNAVEAQPQGGIIIVSTRNQYIDSPIEGYDRVNEGEYLILEIKDYGTGIGSDDLKRIFEPFYTKKVMGRSGTGLGMAVVWGTVQDHKGYINVKSNEGKGTVFELYFPLTREAVAQQKIMISMDYIRGNKESVLIVDDVETQRKIATNMLSKLNYAVNSVSNGEEAVQYIKCKSPDLIVLDMIMDPGIDGFDTYKNIIEIRPAQKAIIVSGFAETDRVKKTQGLGAGEYIKKPYTIEKIGLAIKQELSGQNLAA